MSKEKAECYRSEGGVDSGWLLMDYGDVIIHIFDSAQREYYKLEKLWSKATPLVRIE
jgi:ribosome-associated protein